MARAKGDPRAEAFEAARPPERQCSDFAESDIGNARRLEKRFKGLMGHIHGQGWFVYEPSDGRWHFNEGYEGRRAVTTIEAIQDELRWVKDADAKKARFTHYLKSSQNQRIAGCLAVARSSPAFEMRLSDFDADPDVLNVRNGLVNLRTGELLPHDPAALASRITSCAYDPAAPAPLFERTIEQAFPSKEMRQALQRVFGYCATGHTTEQVFFLFIGSGENSKSTIAEAIRDTLGTYSRTIKVETFLRKRGASDGATPDLAASVGYRLLLTGEIPASARLDESLVKDFTGGDTIAARANYRDPIEFRPVGKLLARGNHYPRIVGTDRGIWRRVRVIEFPVQISEQQRDKDLPHKLREEQPGILRWLIDGARAWYREGLQLPDDVAAATGHFEADMDTLGRWIDEYCRCGADARGEPAQLYKAYVKWTAGAGEWAMPARVFGDELVKRGFQRKASNGKRWHMGIGLLTDGDSDTSDAQ